MAFYYNGSLTYHSAGAINSARNNTTEPTIMPALAMPTDCFFLNPIYPKQAASPASRPAVIIAITAGAVTGLPVSIINPVKIKAPLSAPHTIENMLSGL